MTGLSPFELSYGMIPWLPGTLGTPQKYPSAANFLARIQDNLRLARNKLQQAAKRAKFYVDKKKPCRVFNKGDCVFLQVSLKSTSLSIEKCCKLSP